MREELQELLDKIKKCGQQASELRAIIAANVPHFQNVQRSLDQSIRIAKEIEDKARAKARSIMAETEAVVDLRKLEIEIIEEEIAWLNNELSSMKQQALNKVSVDEETAVEEAEIDKAESDEAAKVSEVSGRRGKIVFSPGRPESLPEPKAYSIQLVSFVNSRHYVSFDQKPGPIHAHSWQVHLKVNIASDKHEQVPFATIVDSIKSVFKPYEDTVLNDLRPYNIFQPTTENMAMYFYNRLEDALSEIELGLDSISLWETPLRGIEVSNRNSALDSLAESSWDAAESPGYSREIAAAVESASKPDTVIEESKNTIPSEQPDKILSRQVIYSYAFRHYFVSVLIISLLAFLAYYQVLTPQLRLHYPWGYDTWGHLLKAEFLYEQILGGNYFPQFTEYWYTGSQPFRYWAPLPYYLLAFLRSFSVDIFMAGNYFIFACALGGGLAWLFLANRIGLLAATLAGVIWSVWIDNVRVAFSEGNLPRVLAAALLPLLFSFFLKVLEEKKPFSAIVIVVALIHGVILSHAMFGAIFSICLGLFSFFLWFFGGCRLRDFLRGILVVAVGILSTGWWLLPALSGGITGINAEAVKAYVAENLIPAAISLDPLFRFANREAFYWGISIIFALAFIILTWRSKPPWAKSLALCGAIFIVLTFPSMRLLYLLLPLGHLLWPIRFSTFAALAVIASSLSFLSAKKWDVPFRFPFRNAGHVVIIVVVLSAAFLLDSFFSVRLLSYTVARAPKFIESAEILQAAPGWRVATIDLSRLGSAPSYLFSEQSGREQVFGWAWQGATTSQNIMLINTGLEFQYYPFLFRSCVFLGGTDLLVKDDVVEDPHTFSLEAGKAGYSHIVTIDGVSIWHAGIDRPYLVEVQDNVLVIGEYAPTIALMFPDVEIGVSIYIDSYDPEDLKRYSSIILYGARWLSKTKAEQVVLDYSASGGEVFVEVTGMSDDVLARQPEFLGFHGEMITLRGQLELMGSEGKSYLLEPFSMEDLEDWKAWVLQGMDEVELEFEYYGMSAPVYGHRMIESGKIHFLGGNLPYHAFLTRDSVALELLKDIFALSTEFTPVSLVPLLDYQASEDGYVMTCRVENDVDVIVPVAVLDGMKIKMNGEPWPYEVYENLLRLKIPAGEHKIVIYLEKPPVYHWGAALSVLSLLSLGYSFFYIRKKL
ncbi:MAG: 6-pyruvoyl-tetrahydropterin synthase-related protein [Bacillota bacterium]|nr:6-pyruvoyl-tetrahydropterin synthase-related protein [Bacillota bacterium]